MDTRFRLFKDYSSNKETRIDAYKKEIIISLSTIGFNSETIKKILNSFDNIPGSDHILGAIKFLTELTDKKSICEDYYLHSDYIAEYYCTISNLGFFAVAYYYNDYATLFAATFSALSHAIPLKRLNELDKIAAVALFLQIIFHYDAIVKNPEIIASGISVFLLGALDIMVGRKNKENFGPSFHVAWHLAAAFALYKFNHALIEMTANDIHAISTAAL